MKHAIRLPSRVLAYCARNRWIHFHALLPALALFVAELHAHDNNDDKFSF